MEDLVTKSELYGVWFLIGAALVFWMQAGFAMVEAGFTRAKNTGNIIMKNLMDFCIGTVVFILIGFGLLLGEDMCGLIGKPGFDIFTAYGSGFDYSNFIFNLVFCATTATIVSGAMAERTKFLSYCIYSAIISALVYPVEAHWVWGGGWLAQRGFHDFAGSTCIHMVGGIAAIVGAAILGPRIGKFTKRKDGSIKVNAFPGHNLTIGALGVFILWFGWYGFNGAAAQSMEELASIFVTTTIAPAVATVVCMIFTWIKYGKPDVSMCLNASLAGLVGITASCDVTDALGSIIVGAVSGVLVVFGVWLLDYKLHIDDPVGAVAVHMMNGIWGTIAVGLFATDTAPAFARGYGDGVNYGANQICGEGLFYGGGFKLLGTQLMGLVSIGVFAAIAMTIVFLVIKALVGLRVTEEEEIVGLDTCEHGLESAYAGFVQGDMAANRLDSKNSKVESDQAIPVQVLEDKQPVASDVKLSRVVILCKQSKFEDLKNELNAIGVMGITVTQVLGCGAQKGNTRYYRGAEIDMVLLPKVKVEVVVSKVPVSEVIKAAKKALYTGQIGDGKIFVYDVENVIKIRTGEQGFDALQGDEDLMA